MIPTNVGPMSALDVLSHCTYTSYATNRDSAPQITPNSWKKVYGPEVDAMEARYQAEKALAKAAA